MEHEKDIMFSDPNSFFLTSEGQTIFVRFVPMILMMTIEMVWLIVQIHYVSVNPDNLLQFASFQILGVQEEILVTIELTPYYLQNSKSGK